MISLNADGTLTLEDDRDPTRTQTLPADASDDDIQAAVAAFFPKGSAAQPISPSTGFPMVRLRMFLISQGWLKAVRTQLSRLPAGARELAIAEFEYGHNFSPASALGGSIQAALGVDTDVFLALMGEAAAFQVTDYGVSKPSFTATIRKFLLG